MPNPGDVERRHNAFSVCVRDFKKLTIKALHKIHPTDRCEFDLHADMIVGGANYILLETSGETANVQPLLFQRKKNHFQMYPLAQLLQRGWTRKPVK
jgi:hypothetical protein